MRLFTGIDLPPDVVRNLEKLADRLRPTARVRWSPSANLHITTRFIGEWPAERVAELKTALATLSVDGAIAIQVRRLGFFPNPGAPRVFWAGVEASPGLAVLAAETDRVLATLGRAPEGRPFSPHLTLARIKEPVPLRELRDAIAALPSLEFGDFSADRFHLYQSRVSAAGSVYTKLAEFPLAK